MSNGCIDLSVAEAAYGKNCDLYRDVLHINPNASPQKIQDAYFARRKHLFQVLSDIEQEERNKQSDMKRRRAERKMDAVVSAVRILGDSELRAKYNDLRTKNRKRMTKQQSSSKPPVELPGLNDTSNSSNLTDGYSTHEISDEEAAPTTRKPSIRKPRVAFSPSIQSNKPSRKQITRKVRAAVDETESTGSVSLISDEEEEGTILTYDDLEEGEIPKRPEGFFDRVRMEFLGALDDTSRSFQQVFHAFTLQEEDIDAVVRRIDKAKLQIYHGNLPRQRRR